ncbi:Cell division protein ZapA [Eubacterium uniforme]|uniref:Cell division protein ZapA n=1 Tax=Eubacterium uniforme TaxID=39495 RepID=A0A1T4V694_9FIRM|nr:Cell division protein ZapA [Eubacterium uniforme]
MSSKNAVDVIIDGKIFTLSGFESDAYLQKIASYLNTKITEYKKDDVYRRQNRDFQHALLEINIADDYFKAKKQADMLENDVEEKDKQIYDLRHELIALQVKLDTLTKENADYNKRVVEYQKRLIKIETMMENSVSAPVSVETTVEDAVEEKPKKTRVRKTTVKKETVETPLEIMAKEASVDEEEKPKKRTRRTTKKTDTPVEE